MKSKLLLASTLALGTLGLSTGASGQVFFSSSSSCTPSVTSVTYTGTTPTNVHICGTLASTKFFCGQTLQMKAASAGESGKFSVTSRTAVAPFNAAPYTDAAPTLPQVIGSPTPTADLGASPTGSSGYAAASAQATRLLTSLQITADATATNSSYVLSFDPNSIFIEGDDAGCTAFAGTTPTATLTMNKAIAPATAVFTITSSVTVTEAAMPASVNAVVTCTGALDGNNTPITVPYTTTNAAGNFSTSPASPLTFSACGGAVQNIAVSPRADDAAVQGTQTGSIVLGAPSAGSLGAATTTTVTVNDNDTPPVFSMGANSGTCAEAASPTNCAFTINRDSGVATATTINFTVSGTATRGTDYVLKTGGCAAGTTLSGTTVSHPNASPLTINVCPIDDLAVEGSETVIFTLNTGSGYSLGATTSATQTIADDDSPQVVTVAVNGPVSEAGGVLTYTFTRAGGSAAAQAATLAVNITLPASSSRYSTTCASPINFAASASTVTCTVTANDNVAVDGNVSATVTVAAPTVAGAYTVGSPSSATGTINDDDVAVNAVAGNSGSATSASVVEGGIARFSVSCPALTAAFTVNYSITPAVPTSGDTFVGGVAPASVAGPAGAASLVAVPTTVQTNDDTVIGNTRNYTMTISVPAGPVINATVIGNAVAVVSVADNDRPLVIPTMGALGLGLMSLMLAGLATCQRRRRA